MDLCRTCGEIDNAASGVTISNYMVFNENKIKITDLLFTLTSLKFSEDNNFSKNICSKCMEHLIRILWFVNKCKQTNERFVREMEVKGRSNKGTEKKSRLNVRFLNSDAKVQANENKLISNCTAKKNIQSSDERVKLLTNKRNISVNLPVPNVRDAKLELEKNVKTIMSSTGFESSDETAILDESKNIVNSNMSDIFLSQEDENEKEEKLDEVPDDFVLKINFPQQEKKRKINKIDTDSNNFVLEENERTDDTEDESDNLLIPLVPKQEINKKIPYIKNNEKEYICKVCNKKLATEPSLRVHLKRHYKVYKAYCEICKKGFVTPPELKKHMRLHAADKIHSCGYCDEHFQTKYNLQLHINSQHVKAANSLCAICKKSFISKARLKHHIRRIHAKNAKYVCNICNEELSFQDLKTHHMMHNVQAVLPELLD